MQRSADFDVAAQSHAGRALNWSAPHIYRQQKWCGQQHNNSSEDQQFDAGATAHEVSFTKSVSELGCTSGQNCARSRCGLFAYACSGAQEPKQATQRILPIKPSCLPWKRRKNSLVFAYGGSCAHPDGTRRRVSFIVPATLPVTRGIPAAAGGSDDAQNSTTVSAGAVAGRWCARVLDIRTSGAGGGAGISYDCAVHLYGGSGQPQVAGSSCRKIQADDSRHAEI